MSQTLSSPSSLTVRDARDTDLPAIRDLYAAHVEHGTASFELEAPTLDEMRARHASIATAGLPYLVAVDASDNILGFCYAGPYHARPAYRHTLETSIYVAEGRGGQGIGKALFEVLIDRCERGPWRQMLAIIGDSDNAGSIALHRRFGFAHVGTFHAVGFKFGRWLDTVLMQRALGDAASPRDP
ncbi:MULTISPECIES: GNAT family N-acetyltransferase [unclassified Modicisalibacter]|uniref:GNAT family N-acetyltransferase n=1 Tax=unclassified Modicisalibacter TaxID=2679913 RepID=UPI001CC952C9|nr:MULTISPECIES: GNAT family N-acetyltransferase [unclassified Modicisalibacter]MBZ9560149.1 N-acetyltransferase [Modicisalibacter sp. R2A 31.J]MBZ9576057.1 N-acetyltransferase [Modicisalibacter sp. MOD 31.J]